MEELERTVEPSWPKLVEPLEKIIDKLAVAWGVINHLKSVKDTPELRAAIEEVQVNFYITYFSASLSPSCADTVSLLLMQCISSMLRM